MLSFCDAVKVTFPADSATPMVFGTFVANRLNLRNAFDDVSLTDATLDALFNEIWNADVNQSLGRQSSRRHIPSSDNRIRSFELVNEEWVVLPAMPPPSAEWKLRALSVSPGDSVDAICTAIVDDANSNGLLLPPMPGPVVAGNAIDSDALEANFFNAQLREGSPPDVVYYYAAENLSTIVDLPPSTDAGGMSTLKVVATPDWLIAFWHYIDRLRSEAIAHSANYEALNNLIADGKVVVEVLNVADNAMTLLEQSQKQPPPSAGFFTQVLELLGQQVYPAQSQKLDIAAFHGKLRALRDRARTEYVETVHFPQRDEFLRSIARLAAIEHEPQFIALYGQFNLARAKYPLTEQAYQIACANYVAARVLEGNSNAYADSILSVYDDGSAGTTPVSTEVQRVFGGTLRKASVDDAVSLITMTSGNAPGPQTLWMLLTKLSLLDKISKVTPGTDWGTKNRILKAYITNLATALDVAPSVLEKWSKAQLPSARSRAVIARFQGIGAQESASLHSGPAFLGALSLLDLWGIYSAIGNTQSDTGLDAVVDWFQAGLATANLAGAVAQGITTLQGAEQTGILGYAATIVRLVLSDAAAPKWTKAAEWGGHVAAFGGVVVGGLQIAQVWTSKDMTRLAAASKIASGAGAILTSVGYWVGLYATKRAPILFAREATAEILGITFTEVGLVELGACLGVVGILVSVVAIAANHWTDLEAFYTDALAPGTQKFVKAIMTQVKASHVLSAGDASVRAALDEALTAAAAATFSVWPNQRGSSDGKDLPTQKLRAIRMNEKDIEMFSFFPINVTPSVSIGP